jgi:hypothetical protein
VPGLRGVFVTFVTGDWQHVGRRPLDDINSTYTPSYNVFRQVTASLRMNFRESAKPA